MNNFLFLLSILTFLLVTFSTWRICSSQVQTDSYNLQNIDIIDRNDILCHGDTNDSIKTEDIIEIMDKLKEFNEFEIQKLESSNKNNNDDNESIKNRINTIFCRNDIEVIDFLLNTSGIDMKN